MKVAERNIFQFQENDFFFPLRDKFDYVKILMMGARLLLLNIDTEQAVIKCRMKLIVDKMSRLFFYQEKKYFSVSFPFTVVIDGAEIVEINTYSGRKLDSKAISGVISILDSLEFRSNPSLIDYYIEPGSIESSGIFLLEEIFLFEPSYIRYDVDAENEKGKLHPLNHLDINYSQNSTYKFGLNEEITENHFENIQNIKTNCAFVVDC